MRPKKIFYGWYIVAACLVITAAGIGIFTSTISVFVKPITDSLGFSRGKFTLYRTIISLLGAFLMPFYGRLIRRTSIKKTMLVSAVGLGLVTISYSFASQLWHFYGIALVNGVFVNGISFMVVGTLVSHWFEDKKGFATGLAFCGSGLGGAIMMPIAGKIIQLYDWRWGFRILGLVGILVLIPTILLVIHDRPEDKGLAPYTQSGQIRKSQPNRDQGLTAQQAFQTPIFWMLGTAFFLISALSAAPHTHFIPYLTDLGHTAVFASLAASALMLTLTLGKILLGTVYDKFGSLTGNGFVSFCCIAFPLAALLAARPAVAVLYAVFLGAASTGFSVPISVLTVKYFGQRDLSVIFSIYSMVATLAAALAVPLMGLVFDVSGSYRPAFWAMLACAALIAVGMIGSELIYRRRAADNS